MMMSLEQRMDEWRRVTVPASVPDPVQDVGGVVFHLELILLKNRTLQFY